MKCAALVYIISMVFTIAESHDHSHHESANTVNQKPIWNYYGKAQIDLEHVLAETKNIWKLQEQKKITQQEAAFYYHKLHDFNSDGYLDGLELIHATRHSIDTMPNKTNNADLENLEKLAEIVDIQLQYFDYDGNGLVEFSELAKYLDENTEKQKHCYEISVDSHKNTEKRKFLWNYYGKADIDLEHVFKEAENILNLHADNKIELLEVGFYYHRLHDFNSDGFLDGLELLRVVQHTHAEYSNHSLEPNLETLADTVDIYLQEIDYNNDGLLDFPEFSAYLKRETTRNNN